METKNATAESLTEMMVGEKIDLNIERPDPVNPVKRLVIENLSCVNKEGVKTLKNASMEAYGGEILGIAGIAGSGQKELLEAVAGLQMTESGSVRYITEDGEEKELLSMKPADIKKLGVALSFVPEDRLGMGLVGSMGMTGNMMLRGYNEGRGIFANRKEPKELAEKIVDQLQVSTPSVNTPVSRLSGGNVQKVLVGREISADPTVLMVAYPVRGLDINSSLTIYDLLNEQKIRGVAVICVGEDYRCCRCKKDHERGNWSVDDEGRGGIRGMTSEHSVSKKEPLVHISKRDRISFGKAWGIRIIAVLISLVVCALVIVALTKLNPLEVYRSIADGAVGTERRLWVTIRDTMILLCIAVGLTPAFKMRFWNIGAEGQILAGAAAAAAVMIYGGDSMSNGVLLVVMFLAGLAAGLVWGLIPAVFKAFLNTNETLFTLMMNYVAMQFVTFCIVFWENPEGSNTVGIINAPTQAGWLPALGEWTYGWNVIIIMAITLLMYFYLKYSKQGYEIAVVGESENTALYAGISVKKVIMRTMAISGAICGIAGFVLVSGASHTISTSTAGGRGFTAIIVAWMSKFNTFAMILVSFFLVFMEKGAIQIASQFNLNENASEVITGIILFFLIGCEFFINYKVEFRKNRKEAK